MSKKVYLKVKDDGSLETNLVIWCGGWLNRNPGKTWIDAMAATRRDAPGLEHEHDRLTRAFQDRRPDGLSDAAERFAVESALRDSDRQRAEYFAATPDFSQSAKSLAQSIIAGKWKPNDLTLLSDAVRYKINLSGDADHAMPDSSLIAAGLVQPPYRTTATTAELAPGWVIGGAGGAQREG